MAILVHYSGSQAKKMLFTSRGTRLQKRFKFWTVLAAKLYQLPYFRVACQMTQGVNNGTICSEMIPSGATTTNTA